MVNVNRLRSVFRFDFNTQFYIFSSVLSFISININYLGRQGICVVDETEKGWFVTYIDRDPETLRRQQEIESKKKLDLDDRQRQQLFLEKQVNIG